MRRILKALVGLIILGVAASILVFWWAPTRSQALFDKILNRPPQPDPIVYKEEKTVRIPEGASNKEIAALLAAQGLMTEEQFIAAQENFPSDKFDFLQDRPKGTDFEGYLYPDTYRFFASSTPEQILDRMLSNFDKKLTPQMRADIKAQGKTVSEIIIMASLIEKEAPISYAKQDNKDAKLVSGIFWNRIKIGQPLQADATLTYILESGKSKHTFAETRTDSPFNTYINRGLMPSPIANPGYLAIEAAIYPTPTNYHYFLTPNNSKQMIYAVTYEEHLVNKRKYLSN